MDGTPSGGAGDAAAVPARNLRLESALEDRYRIERRLGEGGMATVYLARDLKHNRNVALKVLKPELAAVVGAERFLAEIETTANLQHPGILALYDSGEADSFLYYVMPYVEGETLRARLDREKQLPVEDAVRIAGAVAAALDFAHGHGVVHRDVKPANILFQGGQPVVADFGIALAVGAGGGARLTETGLSVGTPYYMSPEQATGDQQVGPASDLYSLGCVLYEMLVGEPPYTGGTAQAVLGKIISGATVTATEHRASVPLHVDAVIRKSLEKVPADRFKSAAEFAAALGDPAFRYGPSAAGAPTSGARPWKIATGVAATGMLLAAGWALAGGPAAEPDAPQIIRLEQQWPWAEWWDLQISPDGSFLLQMREDTLADRGVPFDGETSLWIQRWDGLPATEIREARGLRFFGISPDGTAVAIAAGDDALRVLDVDGGAPVTLHPDVGFSQLAWADDGYIYGNIGNTRRPMLLRVPEVGGEAEEATVEVPGRMHAWPTALPGGRGVLYVSALRAFTANADSIGVVDSETGEERILSAGRNPWYSPSGHLVWVSEGQLVAAPFDLETLRLTGEPRALADGVPFFRGSESGDLVYWEGPPWGGRPEVAWVERDGSGSALDWTFEVGSFNPEDPALSPDGGRLALRVPEGDQGVIYVIDLRDGVRTRLAVGARPTWSSDGRYVGFTTLGTPDGAWRVRADGSAPPERRTGEHANADFQVGQWSLEGPLVVGTSTGLAVVEAGDSLARPVLEGDVAYQDPALSPDGRWVAYTAPVDGEPRVFVRPFPDVTSALYPISSGRGDDVRWSSDGRTLYYVGVPEQTRYLWAAQVRTEPDFEVVSREPRFLYQSGGGWNTGGWLYDVTPDGERAVVVRRRLEPWAPHGLVLIQNFDELLRERLGG